MSIQLQCRELELCRARKTCGCQHGGARDDGEEELAAANERHSKFSISLNGKGIARRLSHRCTSSPPSPSSLRLLHSWLQSSQHEEDSIALEHDITRIKQSDVVTSPTRARRQSFPAGVKYPQFLHRSRENIRSGTSSIKLVMSSTL
jgi:hypothetical protein